MLFYDFKKSALTFLCWSSVVGFCIGGHAQSPESTASEISAEASSVSELKNSKSTNYCWDSIQDYWRQQSSDDSTPTYPTLHLSRDTKVGDVGVGDAKQSLSVLSKRGDSEFLVSAWQSVESVESTKARDTAGPVFLFRRFDFSSVAAGGDVPTPGLCQVTGTFQYFDAVLDAQRSVLVVEPLAKSNLPLPSSNLALTKISMDQSATKKPPKNTLRPETVSQATSKKPAASKNSATSKNANHPTPDTAVQQVSNTQLTHVQADSRPRFEVRTWVRLNQYQDLQGKLVGVGCDAIWVLVGGGQTLRVPLESLDANDREHALAKKEAILSYRRQQAQHVEAE